MGHLDVLVSKASDSCSGHDLRTHEFEPRIGLWADSSEPDVGLELVNHEIMT